MQADWKDSFKKKQAGVSDMTLLSTISEDAINDNLKKRFENAEIYVSDTAAIHFCHNFRLTRPLSSSRPTSATCLSRSIRSACCLYIPTTSYDHTEARTV